MGFWIIQLALVALIGGNAIAPKKNRSERKHQRHIAKSISTAEDMIEWTRWDIEEGDIDSLKGELMIQNLNEIITDLKLEQ